MDISDWRKQIDEMDRKLVELINQRARAAQEIGRLKRNTSMPVYEPDREKEIFENIFRLNQGPLSNHMLQQVYERLIDVMRKIQIVDQQAEKTTVDDTELEADVND